MVKTDDVLIIDKNKMQLIFVFKKLSLTSLFFLFIVKKIGWKVLITSCEKSFIIKKIYRFFSISKDMIFMDFTINKIQPDVINGDYSGIIKDYINQLFEDDYLSSFMNIYYLNNKKIIHKCKVYLHNYLTPQCLQHKITYWLETSKYRDATIINFTSMKPGEKFFWKRTNIRVFNIFCYSNFFISLFFRLIIKSLSFLKLILTDKKPNKKSISDNNFVPKNNQVLLFDEYFINKKNGNPPRDSFYSKDIKSPFYPSNILHLSFSSRTDLNQEDEYIKQYLNVDDFEYRSLSFDRLCLLDVYKVFKFSFHLLFKLRWIHKGHFFNQLTLLFPLIAMYYIFIVYKNSTNLYKYSPIALIGYDMLLPAGLALALEHHKIKTIAIQERFISTFLNSWPYILDVQLTISGFTSSYLKANNMSLIGETIPVGFIRTDNFFDKVVQSENLRVIVLDYHVEKDDECQQKFYPVVNWANDIRFRKEILKLAISYPNVDFIFRGKNIDWMETKFHKKLIEQISRLKNVTVDSEYDDKFRSYHLCAGSDLIIANPTSLAEECVSAGMSVIVVDYGINYTHSLSRWLPELMQDYYCQSFEELKEMFASFIKSNHVISEDKKNKIKREVFSNLSDGNVRNRVQENLKLIYENIELNPNNIKDEEFNPYL